MNIWVAYLNLENMYGTTESLQEVLTRALQYNDQITLYQQLINIYIKSGKMQVGLYYLTIFCAILFGLKTCCIYAVR